MKESGVPERGWWKALGRAALLVGLAASAAWPPAARALTLDEALVSAYLTNPTLDGQRAALRATDELVPQALGGYRPTVAVESSAALADIDSSSGGGGLTTVDNALRLDQPLYRGGETVANVRRSELLVRLERARLTATEQDVLFDAVDAYTTLLTDLAVLELATSNVDRLRRQLQATRDRFEVGEVTRTDVAQAEASLAGARAERVRAEGAIEASRATFRSVIGLEPDQLVPPRPLATLPPSEAEAQQLAQTLNPNVAAAQFSLAAARQDVDIAQSALYPRLSVTGELSYTEEPSLALDWQRSASIGANLAVPLYQSGAEYARVRQAKETVGQRQRDLDGILRAVRQEVTRAWQELATARSRIESITEQVRAAEIALEGSRQEALVGQRTTLDVLDQENDLFQAEVDLVSAQRDEIVASYGLRAAIGQLTAAAVELPVEPYDPEAHYQDVRDRWFGLGDDPTSERQQ
jgi:TolC family type I secretion outer membrane protein